MPHSTLSPPISPPLASVLDFFNYKLPPYKKDPQMRSSPNTREPSLYDKHLHPELQLRRVRYLPSIIDHLINIAEDALRDASLRLPATKAEGYSTWDLPAIDKTFMQPLIDEKSVQDQWGHGFGSHCAAIVSMLAYHLPAWQAAPMWYTDTVITKQSKAIADGFVCMKELETLSPDVAEAHRAKLTIDVAKTFRVLATYEFKSILAGSLETLDAIMQRTSQDKFPWDVCTVSRPCSSDCHAKLTPTPDHGNRMGLDAETPIVDLTRPETYQARFGTFIPELPDLLETTQTPKTKSRYILQQVRKVNGLISQLLFIALDVG